MGENIYDAVDNGDNIYDDINGMSLDEMEDYFMDADPSEYLQFALILSTELIQFGRQGQN